MDMWKLSYWSYVNQTELCRTFFQLSRRCVGLLLYTGIRFAVLIRSTYLIVCFSVRLLVIISRRLAECTVAYMWCSELVWFENVLPSMRVTNAVRYRRGLLTTPQTRILIKSINQSCIFRVVQVIKSLQDPLEVGNNLTGHQRRRNGGGTRPRNVETTGARVSFRPRNIFPHFCTLFL